MTTTDLGVNSVLVSTRVHSDISKFSVENKSYRAYYHHLN